MLEGAHSSRLCLRARNAAGFGPIIKVPLLLRHRTVASLGGLSTSRSTRSTMFSAAAAASPSSDLKVVICGGGIIGAATAYYLAQLGVAATVVEREGVACAASGKAGGFLALDWCDSSPVGALARKSFALHEQLSKDLGVDVGYRKVRTLQVTGSEKAPAGGNGKTKRNDILPSWLDGNVIKAAVMGDYDSTAQVHPYKLTHALMDAASAKVGTAVLTGQVTGVTVEGNKVTGVLVDGRNVPANCVVIAMGPWTGDAARWLPVPLVTGTKAASILLRPKEPFTDHMLFTSFRDAKGGHQNARMAEVTA